MYAISEKSFLLITITEKLINKEEIKDLIPLIKEIKPFDVIDAFHSVVAKGYNMEDIKIAVNKVLNLCYNSMKKYPRPEYDKFSVFKYLDDFNITLKDDLKKVKIILKHIHNQKSFNEYRQELKKIFSDFMKLDAYYKIKENILFSYIEKYYPNYNCIKIMWAEHDDVRDNLKKLITLLEKDDVVDLSLFNIIVGKLFFDINSLIFRESLILYPSMNEVFDNKLQIEILKEIVETNLLDLKLELNSLNEDNTQHNFNINLSTGELTSEQIRLIFDHLPVDITFIDENDEVRYFSNPKDRVFIRTKSILGRKVQNCHPHDSVDVVNKILDSFKKGEKDHAFFWIPFKDKFLFIQYYAVRDEKNRYKGVIEVTQDISGIKKIDGVRKLLDW
jgi:DUF438 domain-containing protein